MTNLNPEVTAFLDGLNHPLRTAIERLRALMLHADSTLAESIKWNGPNYSMDGHDRITMSIQPPKQIRLIFHRGARVQEQPKVRLINDPSGLLAWKENDRAVTTFKTLTDVENNEAALSKIITDWLDATCNR